MFLYVKSPFINYEIEFNRKVTIIQGDSGTGKSKILEAIKRLRKMKSASIYTTNGNKVVMLKDYMDWEGEINNSKNVVFLIDEDCEFIRSNSFARSVHNSLNYFIIISRDPINGLNYSYDEIYELKTSGKYNKTVRKYNLEKFNDLSEDCQVVLVEDSGSGYEFYRYHLPMEVFSIEGKSKMAEAVRRQLSKNNVIKIGIIVDGAAFGSEMGNIKALEEDHKDVDFDWFLPESTEGFIVKNDILNFRSFTDKLSDKDEIYYSGAEIMYYKLLRENTVGTPALYSKEFINSCYTEDCCHKKCSGCKFYTRLNKKEFVNTIVFKRDIREGDVENDKLLFE